MDWKKYNQVPLEFATASAIGLAAATLGAMERRGLVESKATKPKQYRRIENPSIKIYQLLEENKNDFDEFFMLKKKDARYGMLCSLKKGTIMDCWGKEYDLTDVNYLQIGKKEFNI